jgi:hypothetical protein
MASIFIVNHSISGPYAQCFSSFHKTEEEGAGAFVDCKNSVGEDPALIELIRLDTETLDAVTIYGWEGNIEDLEEDDEDDWVCEGAP